jgi:ABC-type Fe3+ transport system permease subunit
MIEDAPRAITWIKVDKPKFDLVGLVLNSAGATLFLALCALVLGVALGLVLIRRRQRARRAASDQLIRLPLSDAPEGHETGLEP